MEKLDLLVVIDPYPTVSAVMQDRKDGIYLLPASTQFETYGSVTASNRSFQWRERVVEPIFESQARSRDHVSLREEVRPRSSRCSRTSQVERRASRWSRTSLREFNRGMWTIGYTGQSPERLKAHHGEPAHLRCDDTLQAEGGPVDGDYYGLPWPCWGTAGDEASGHAEPLRYLQAASPKAASTFRARFGVEKFDGVNLLAEGSYGKVGSEIKDGYPEFSDGDAEEAGLGQ